MSTHRNCPNCGAPYEIERNRCPYCGTAYFDLSTIDLDNHEPFFLQMRQNGMLITQLVSPTTASYDIHREEAFAYGWNGRRLTSVTTAISATTLLELAAIPFKSELAGGKEVMYLAVNTDDMQN